MKILIVEDDEPGLMLLKWHLKGQGETVIAKDGEKAVALFQEARDQHQPFDLVCLDIMLPLLNGQEVLKRIRVLEAEVGIVGLACAKVVMLTALQDANNVMRAFRNQCEAYLPKPISKEKLYREIRSLGLTVKQTE